MLSFLADSESSRSLLKAAQNSRVFFGNPFRLSLCYISKIMIFDLFEQILNQLMEPIISGKDTSNYFSLVPTLFW